MTRKTTRRDFVKQTSAVGAAWWAGTNLGISAEKERSAVERLNFACIGVGGKGSSDTDSAGRAGNVVALCDIDDRRLAQKAKKFPQAKKFNDYREMLDELGPTIDAVTVSTPDHTHAPASIRAMKMGKHCFCQKPLTWSVEEARKMRELAAKKKVATQMGNQGTSHTGLREAVELVKAGGLGDVKEVHIWTNRPIWPQGKGRPTKVEQVPGHVNWDLFLGAAPVRPYHSGYHPFKWRGWLDFGTGALGDMACHTANMAVMALDLFDPISFQAVSSGIVENETYPSYSTITFEFGKRTQFGPCTMTWYDGCKRPPRALLQGKKMVSSGSLLVGSKGTLYSPNDYGSKYFLLPEKDFVDYQKPAPTLPRSPGHFKEFAIACKGGKPAMSNFNYSGRLTETILLGNLALHSEKKLLWDAKNLKVTNDKSVNEFIRREYRSGFGI
ncbi:MAG: Gfo/Idh/MocA family oxidoreductase [Planctomycetes bacterium]|nr:Gfo/Idh/MocA family oxidoreductase [Planctomycetota bacterium]